ncbi:MAG: phosphatase PAP2 family protein [Gallionellaceae bacterium]
MVSKIKLFFGDAWQWGVPLFAVLALGLLQALGGNIPLFLWINELTFFAGTAWWSHVTMLGDASLILLLILPMLGRRPEWAWQFVLAAIFASLWTHGMKELFYSSRPPAVLAEGSFHLIGPFLELSSFPSGHTTTIFVVAALVCVQDFKLSFKISILSLSIVVALSRIACGVHWPVDILGGMFGGWMSALAGVALAGYWRLGLTLIFQRVLALSISALAVWTIFHYDNQFPGTEVFHALFAVSCLIVSLPGQYRLFKIR